MKFASDCRRRSATPLVGRAKTMERLAHRLPGAGLAPRGGAHQVAVGRDGAVVWRDALIPDGQGQAMMAAAMAQLPA
jgi:hypothetical protein